MTGAEGTRPSLAQGGRHREGRVCCDTHRILSPAHAQCDLRRRSQPLTSTASRRARPAPESPSVIFGASRFPPLLSVLPAPPCSYHCSQLCSVPGLLASGSRPGSVPTYHPWLPCLFCVTLACRCSAAPGLGPTLMPPGPQLPSWPLTLAPGLGLLFASWPPAGAEEWGC